MIYQIGIGAYDNCYIITGGLTGLTSFDPVLVNGDSNACSIIVDKKDDSIFSPWIKQSLKVSLIKETETDYAEIIAGNDNETYGILIEGGELELTGADITITIGGILKFIGTLALESYSEQYKELSIVSFTFNDRIGAMEDEEFKTNVQYKSVTDIIACCIHGISCSHKLYMEWPYSISGTPASGDWPYIIPEVPGSSDPTDLFLDILDFEGKTNLETLEQILYDFGLQLKVDFESNNIGTLTLSGAVKITSINNNSDQSNTFWSLSLDSYVATSCGNTYYTYTGSVKISFLKIRQLMATSIWMLMNNDTKLDLERVASSIIAKNDIEEWETMVYKGVYSEDYVKKVTYISKIFPFNPYTVKEYCPFIFVEGEGDQYGDENLYQDIVDLARGDKSAADFPSPLSMSRLGNKGVGLYTIRDWSPNKEYRAICTRLIYINHNQFTDDIFKLHIEFTASGYRSPYTNPVCYLHMTLIMLKDNVLYYNNGSTWSVFTNQDQLKAGNTLNVNMSVDSTKTIEVEITSTSSVVIMPVFMNEGVGSTEATLALIKSLIITPTLEDDADVPASITLTTDLSGNNRKTIEINPVFLNSPNVLEAGYGIKNIILDSAYDVSFTLKYKKEYQTLLAHLSDQYGWQYDGNRWNVEGACKVVDGSINLMGQFGLDEKVLILLSGEYDARRKELKGKWGQVLEIEDNQYRLLQDNFIPFTWDDGKYIMLN